MTKHSALPWKLDPFEVDRDIFKSNGRLLGTTYGEFEKDSFDDWTNDSVIEAKANAEFIVRACNSHYQLLDALYMALPYVESELDNVGYKIGVKDRVLKQIHAAINKAEGR